MNEFPNIRRAVCVLLAVAGGAGALQYAEDFLPLNGSVTVRHVNCQAAGLPALQGAIYLIRRDALTYQTARIEYNEPARLVLENGRNSPKVKQYYDRYILGRQPVSRPVFDALLGLWRLFGTRFSWGEAVYQCELS